MRYLLILIFISITSICYADLKETYYPGRVCLEKSTGKLIEYQSGNVNDDIQNFPLEQREKIKFERLNSLKQNAINAGYTEENIIVKEINSKEWKIIKQTQIIKPAQDLAMQKELERQVKEQAIKTKMNLSDEDFKNLKEALK